MCIDAEWAVSMQGREKQQQEKLMQRNLYHPWTPDVGQMLLGGWQVGCVPPREVKVEVIVQREHWQNTDPFRGWFDRVATKSLNRFQVPSHLKMPCGCQVVKGGQHLGWNRWEGGKTSTEPRFVQRWGNSFICQRCRKSVTTTNFAKWLKGVKEEQPEATRLRVPGEIITMLENICTCPICPCGCYTEARGGKQYFIEKRNGVFVHDYCGEAVE